MSFLTASPMIFFSSDDVSHPMTTCSNQKNINEALDAEYLADFYI